MQLVDETAQLGIEIARYVHSKQLVCPPAFLIVTEDNVQHGVLNYGDAHAGAQSNTMLWLFAKHSQAAVVLGDVFVVKFSSVYERHKAADLDERLHAGSKMLYVRSETKEETSEQYNSWNPMLWSRETTTPGTTGPIELPPLFMDRFKRTANPRYLVSLITPCPSKDQESAFLEGFAKVTGMIP